MRWERSAFLIPLAWKQSEGTGRLVGGSKDGLFSLLCLLLLDEEAVGGPVSVCTGEEGGGVPEEYTGTTQICLKPHRLTDIN